MTQISITRALTEVKHLSDRINRAAAEPFVGLAKGRDNRKVCVNSPSSSIAEVTAQLTSNLQAVTDMVNRREKLKRLIINSNANTTVVINGDSMSVAEAIEKKASVDFKKTLLAQLRAQYTNAARRVETENVKLMQEVDNAVQQAYGNDKGKVEADQYDAVAKPRMDHSQFSMIDPNKAEQLIKALDDEITGFLQEVDFVLSESNARTSIEV